MGRSQLSNEIIKSIDSFVSISDVIEEIYDSMAEVAILYGKESDEYKRLVDNLMLSIECEEQILSKLSRYDTNLINDYLMNLDCERAINKYNFYCEENRSLGNKQLSLVDIFHEIYLNNIFNLLVNDTERPRTKNLKNILVSETYDMLIDYPSLEKKILNNCSDFDSLFLYDNSFVSMYFNMDIDNYKTIKRIFFIDNAINIMKELLLKDNKDIYDLRYRAIMEIRLRSCFLELSDDNIEYLYSYYEKNNVGSLGSRVIDNAFFKSSNDLSIDGITKKKTINS